MVTFYIFARWRLHRLKFAGALYDSRSEVLTEQQESSITLVCLVQGLDVGFASDFL